LCGTNTFVMNSSRKDVNTQGEIGNYTGKIFLNFFGKTVFVVPGTQNVKNFKFYSPNFIVTHPNFRIENFGNISLLDMLLFD
jgi:hypothetical protein